VAKVAKMSGQGQDQDQDQDQDKWYDEPPTGYDSDTETDEETGIIVPKEEGPVSEVSNEFRKKVTDMKHVLYDNIVLSPEMGTADAQNNGLVDDYVAKINKIYRLTLGAQKGLVAKESTLAEFPVAVRDDIQWVLRWIADFFPKNGVAKTIPYEDFLYTRLHVYPFVQN